MAKLNLYSYPSSISIFPVCDKSSQIDFVGFFLCLKGSADLLIDMKQFALKECSICVVLPYTTIKVISHSDDFAGLGLTSDPQLLDYIKLPNIGEYFLAFKNCPCVEISKSDSDSLYEFSMYVSKKTSSNYVEFSSQISDCLSLALSYEIVGYYTKYSNYKSNSYSRQDEIFRSFINLVYENYKVNRSLNFYAEKLCLSPRYLSSIIKQKTGSPASHWITTMVVTDAKNFLKNSDLSVQQIAIELNFPNASFFGQYFRKYVGTTPNNYRRKDN